MCCARSPSTTRDSPTRRFAWRAPGGEPILVIAVSARMLAELGVRAGYDVVALDRFGDLDLRRLCPSVSALRDLGGRGGMAALVDAAEKIQAPSVIYGAG